MTAVTVVTRLPTIRLEPELVQAVIAAQLEQSERAGNARLGREYHALADPLYTRVAPDERERAFERMHVQFFEQLGFTRLVARVWQEFPELGIRAPSLLLLAARLQHEEGAVIGHDGASVCLRVLPWRFANPERLTAFVRHELAHACDMLDPEFGYEITHASTRAQSNRLAECYHTLWCAAVDARLLRRASAPLALRDEHRRAFDACFAMLSDAARAALFEKFWNTERISHAEILKTARAIEATLRPERILGARCPLCRFQTHRWAAEIEPSVAALIRADFVGWREQDGACERCVESYALVPS